MALGMKIKIPVSSLSLSGCVGANTGFHALECGLKRWSHVIGQKVIAPEFHHQVKAVIFKCCSSEL